jgi:hypothetical protein
LERLRSIGELQLEEARLPTGERATANSLSQPGAKSPAVEEAEEATERRRRELRCEPRGSSGDCVCGAKSERPLPWAVGAEGVMHVTSASEKLLARTMPAAAPPHTSRSLTAFKPLKEQ